MKQIRRMAVRAAVLGMLLPAAASANGRYPRAQILKPYKDDLVFAGTFGMMVSADKGKSWYFVCEKSILGDRTNLLEIIDLFLERGSDGTIITGSTNRGVHITRDLGCNVKAHPNLPIPPEHNDGKFPYGYVVDIAPARAKSDQAFIAVASITNSDRLATTVQYHQLYQSLDNGQTFTPLGPQLSATEIGSIYTIDVAPKNANLMYMTIRPRDDTKEDQIWVSKDGGLTWPDRYNIRGSRDRNGDGSFIAAVHPDKPDMIFLRSQHWTIEGGLKAVDDSVRVSRDGGQTWDIVLQKKAKPLAFALSPDGRTVLIGFGNHGIPAEGSNSDDNGIYKADIDNLQFQRITWGPESDEGTMSIGCLTWTSEGLYVCASPADDPFTIGFRKDADFTPADPNPFTPLLVDKEAKGPLPWIPANSPRGDTCIQEWLLGASDIPNKGICATFGQCPESEDAGVKIGSGPPVCSSSGGSTGSGGTSSSGGSGGAGGFSGTAGTVGPSGKAGTSSCGCQVPGTSGRGGMLGLALAAIGGGAALRRRQRKAITPGKQLRSNDRRPLKAEEATECEDVVGRPSMQSVSSRTRDGT